MHADFDSFYRDEYGAVLRTVRLVLGDAERAEEVTQEAFVRALKRWSKVREMTRPGGWVAVVAVNADRKRWRRESRGAVTPTEETSRDHASSVVVSLTIREALFRLTVRQRAAVVLRYLTDLPIADIATALGCAEGTAKATLHQALSALRADLSEVDEDEER
jgi:RNA polymerase sigma-70 factor (sigma-E family)